MSWHSDPDSSEAIEGAIAGVPVGVWMSGSRLSGGGTLSKSLEFSALGVNFGLFGAALVLYVDVGSISEFWKVIEGGRPRSERSGESADLLLWVLPFAAGRS
jgi:hypothetical protein